MKNIKRSMASKCSIEFNNTNYIKNMLRNINSNRNTTFISLSIFKIIIFISLTNNSSLFFLFTNFTLFLLPSFILSLNSFTTNNSINLCIFFRNNKFTFLFSFLTFSHSFLSRLRLNITSNIIKIYHNTYKFKINIIISSNITLLNNTTNIIIKYNTPNIL